MQPNPIIVRERRQNPKSNVGFKQHLRVYPYSERIDNRHEPLKYWSFLFRQMMLAFLQLGLMTRVASRQEHSLGFYPLPVNMFRHPTGRGTTEGAWHT